MLPDKRAPAAARSSILPEHRNHQAWMVVLIAYIVIYSSFLLKTDGYPYVLDNNESYSNWWHARSLYENGITHTKGLTDEVFSTSPAASPYIHSHQGNLPRLYTFLIYALGFRSISSHIWITTFTIGLLGIYFAFRFITNLTNARYATITCLVMMTNYLLFSQWQVSLYNVWHVFFFFSSLLCVQAVGRADHRVCWALLTLLNFTAFFYWEYVFTAFVTTLCALYTLVLYWRQPITLLRAWLLASGGALLAAAVLMTQLVAYMGWKNVQEDVHLTLTARNSIANPALLERIASFYRENSIIFWHNFLDAAPLRTAGAFWASMLQNNLRYYTPTLLLSVALLGAGWLLGRWQMIGGLRRQGGWAGKITGGLKWLTLAALLSWMTPAVLISVGAPTLQPMVLLPVAAVFSLLLGRIWLGGWWAWDRFGWLRFLSTCTFVLVTHSLAGASTGLADSSFQESLAETIGSSGTEAISKFIPIGTLLIGLSCAALGNAQVFGRHPACRLIRLPSFFVCTLLAYLATYRLFTGYVYSGYLYRMVPMLVFFTDMMLAVVIYAVTALLWSSNYRFSVHRPKQVWFQLYAALLLGLLIVFWVQLQRQYFRVAPPDSYAFLSKLEAAPYKGHSIVSNTYPAPMAARTKSWGYSDPSLFSGQIKLTPRGFERDRDLKYLWFHDRETNLAYLKPDFAVVVLQTPNIGVAMQLKHDRDALPRDAPPLAESTGLVRRTQPMQQAFFHDELTYSNRLNASIVKLDWDYPPFLRPDLGQFLPNIGALSLSQKLALSESAQKLRRRWRVTISLVGTTGPDEIYSVLNEATIDGQPISFSKRLKHSISAVEEGGLLQLSFQRNPHAGRIRLEVNDRSEELDLSAAASGLQTFRFSSANPHGSYSSIPIFAPGSAVQTTIKPQRLGPIAEVRYHFTHQENSPEACSKVRVYAESNPEQWYLADTITFLGPRGIPVRMEEFTQANPETVDEYNRVIKKGDARSYEQWLADYLSSYPTELSRHGVVQESLPLPDSAIPSTESIVSRRVPLPQNGNHRWQISVAPGTRTKTGPEYFGLPFSLPTFADPSSSASISINLSPPESTMPSTLKFGRLKLRLRFPLNRWPQSEPLVSTGSLEAGDFIYAYYTDAHHIQFGFDHWFKGGPVSKPIAIDFTKEHELEISMGSLFPAEDAVVFATASTADIQSVKNRVLVILDGEIVVDSAGECYETSSDTVTIGRNDIKGTLSGPLFTGKILAAERVWPLAH